SRIASSPASLGLTENSGTEPGEATGAICGGSTLERERSWKDSRCHTERWFRDLSPMAAIGFSAEEERAGRCEESAGPSGALYTIGNMPALDFNHAMLYTRDVSASLRFYADQLGFKLIETYEWQGRPVYARLKAPKGTGSLALHLPEPGQSVPPSGGVRLYFEVKDVEKVCKKLEAAGVAIKQQPKLMPWGWTHAYLDDPDGHEISLYWAGAKRFKKSKMAAAK